MTTGSYRRPLWMAPSLLLLASCAGGTASAPAPTSVAPAAVAHGAIAEAARRAPFSLADYHGAVGAYLDALRSGGYLAAPKHATSWINRAAFDATADDGDDSRPDSARSTMAVTPRNDRHLLFGTSDQAAVVDIYQTNLAEPQNQNQPLIGQIALPTYGVAVAVDNRQHIYVSAGRNVYEYTRASLPNPVRTIALPHTAEGIAVDSTGVLYAASFFAYAEKNVGVYVVAPRATTYTSTLSDPRINNAFDLAVDSNRDLFVVYTKAPADPRLAQALGEFPAGSTAMTQLPVAENPGDVQVDAAGDLLVTNADPDANTASLDTIPSGSITASKSIVLETKFDYVVFDHKPATNDLYLIEQNVGTSTTDSPIYQEQLPGGTQIDAISHGSTYFRVASAPFGKLPPAYAPPNPLPMPSPSPVASASPQPVGSPAPASCTNGARGPILDPQKHQLTFGGGTFCTGPGAYQNNVDTTVTLYNAATANTLSTFSFADTASSHADSRTIACPFTGSYYLTVSSPEAPTVTSTTVTPTKDASGSPTC